MTNRLPSPKYSSRKTKTESLLNKGTLIASSALLTWTKDWSYNTLFPQPSNHLMVEFKNGHKQHPVKLKLSYLSTGERNGANLCKYLPIGFHKFPLGAREKNIKKM